MEDVHVCPACNGKTAQKVVYGRVGDPEAGIPLTLDECTRCHGIWFDATEVEEVIGAKVPVASLAKAPPTPHGCRVCGHDAGGPTDKCPACKAKTRLTCARCSRPMNLVVILGIRVDVCPSCSSLYLDQGELETLSYRYADHYEVAPDAAWFSCPGCQTKVSYDDALYGSKGMMCKTCFHDGSVDEWKDWHSLGKPTGLLHLLLGIFKRDKTLV